MVLSFWDTLNSWGEQLKEWVSQAAKNPLFILAFFVIGILVFKIVYIISLFFLVYITYCYWIHIGYYDQQWHVRWFY